MSVPTASRIPEMQTRIPFETDRGIAARAALGLIVLATDQSIENDFRRYTTLDGVATFHSRIPNAAQITPETLRDMERHIGAGAKVILPDIKLDVIAFGCTSATMLLGEDAIYRHIRSARGKDIPCTSPVTGAIAALEALGARRIAVLTPYGEDVNEVVAKFLADRGLDIVTFGTFSEYDDRVVARISPRSVREAILSLGRGRDVDAVFVSCTTLRVGDQLSEIETALGKPVTASTHAMAWHALRLAGVGDRLPQYGRLFTL